MLRLGVFVWLRVRAKSSSPDNVFEDIGLPATVSTAVPEMRWNRGVVSVIQATSGGASVSEAPEFRSEQVLTQVAETEPLRQCRRQAPTVYFK
jgi:hypothetical protein